MEAGDKKRERLIMMMNHLQDAFAASKLPLGLKLPRIVVVGGQSVGKSSVLENFVGRDFLPRGKGIVTRRPLVLQLINDSEEYATFQHDRTGYKYAGHEFDRVRQEIEDETEHEVDGNKGISSRPINLKIHSPNVLDLTLVDLPGMTRVPVGDQPEDIENQIKDMVLDFVREDNTLILAVSAANTDLANSDAMKIAHEVDPNGERTIGVLTKLDIMDEGTDAGDLLNGSVVPLKRGYVGVVNRSQKEVDSERDMKHAREKEEEFFMNHDVYSKLDCVGTQYLQEMLHKQLETHIQNKLPGLKKKLVNNIEVLRMELQTLEDRTNVENMRLSLIKAVQKFADRVEIQIRGLDTNLSSNKLAGGAKIKRLFYDEFAKDLQLNEVDEEALKREIGLTIENFHAIRNGVFCPDVAFENVVKRKIKKFHDPVQQCVERVSEIVGEILEEEADEILYDKLKERVITLVSEFLDERKRVTKVSLETHVNAEASFTNIRHEDFIRSLDDAPHHAQNCPEFTQSLDNVKRKLENFTKVFKEGSLLLLNSENKFVPLWCKLVGNVLLCYLDKEDTTTTERQIPVTTAVRQKELDTGGIFRLDLCTTEGRSGTAEHRLVSLGCEEEDELQEWISMFKSCGVYPEGTLAMRRNIGDQDTSPEIERQTQKVYRMVQSYLKIVSKTMRDMVPKYIVHLLVDNTQEYVKADLLSKLLAKDDVVRLMRVDPDELEKKKYLHHLCREAERAYQIICEEI